ncbi:hypothetical protein EZ449_22150 [Pedobacter frigidisoli]|uniref:YD repeat-containing protein n=1 Tax=Pedobacter frigidisoli TaxID=2530455 RepID=A0A4V6N5X0_9SPHI|nr:RHS repeat domain-containing protein [Pedobacter frigidisoli]TCC96776.1 hypothetical protein EZ449_22150 [Pedobacter frigidisoli]
MLKSIIVWLLMIVAISAFAQSSSLNPTFSDIIPPSPGASAIGKFGSIPVGLSTGIPQIGVPIFNWEGKSFGKSVSVSLDYHNGGVKVDELASSVGLNWALNAGGVITRAVRGIYDEYDVTGYLYNTLPQDEYANGPNDYPVNERLLNRMYSGKVDTQNDLFSYSFNGVSGRFLLGKNNDILILDQAKLKIEKFITTISGYNKISKFVITDESGYQFEFSDYEITQAAPGAIAPSHTSAWYLSKIFNPSHSANILFEYESCNLIDIQITRTQTQALPVRLDGIAQAANLGGISGQTTMGKRLVRIKFPDQDLVTFSYKTSTRQDVTYASTDALLEKIKISNSTSSFGFLLTQDYSLGGRATLLAVTPFGNTEQQLSKPYEFTYFPGILPPRFSSRKDHWGYINSNPSPITIPREYVRVDGGANGGPYREFIGGDRETDPDAMKVGSMTKIKYPTGGYTTFEMESNTAVDTWMGSNNVIAIPKLYNEIGMNFAITSSTYPSGTTSFTFEGENNTSTYFDCMVNPYLQPCASGVGCGVKFEMYSPTGGLMSTQAISFPSSNSNRQMVTFGIVNLEKGKTYSFKVYLFGNISNYYDYGEIRRREATPPDTYIYEAISGNGTKKINVGGLRVSLISDYTGDGTTPASVKSYQYVLENGTTSSGALGYRPIYSYLVNYGYIANGQSNYEPSAEYVIRSSNSVNEIPMISGSPVTYKRVVEKSIQYGVETGKIVTNFLSFADSQPYMTSTFPTVPPNYSFWLYGTMRSEEVYDATNFLQKKTENIYSSFPFWFNESPNRFENFRSISIAPVMFAWDGDYFHPKIIVTNTPTRFKVSGFVPSAGRNFLSQSKTTEYTRGQAPKEIINNFTYDNFNFNIKEVVTTNSDESEIKKMFIYPQNMVDGGLDASLYGDMVAQHIINPVIKESNYVNGAQTFLKHNKYAKWYNSFFDLETVSTQTSAGPEEVRLRYLQYSAEGTPLSLRKEHGAPMCYVWSNFGTRIIAKVENADYPSVIAALGGQNAVDTFSEIHNPDALTIGNFLQPLRNTLIGAFVTSFVYDPLGNLLSQTDPKNLTLRYEYDGFQRLRMIKDDNGDIVKTFCYNYAGQQVDCGELGPSLPTNPPTDPPLPLVYTHQTSYSLTRLELCPTMVPGQPVAFPYQPLYSTAGLGQVALMPGQSPPLYYSDPQLTQLAPNGYYSLMQTDPMHTGYFIYHLVDGSIIWNGWCDESEPEIPVDPGPVIGVQPLQTGYTLSRNGQCFLSPLTSKSLYSTRSFEPFIPASGFPIPLFYQDQALTELAETGYYTINETSTTHIGYKYYFIQNGQLLYSIWCDEAEPMIPTQPIPDVDPILVGYSATRSDICGGVPLLSQTLYSVRSFQPLLLGVGQVEPLFYTDSAMSQLAPTGYYTIYEVDPLHPGYRLYYIQNGQLLFGNWCDLTDPPH